MTIKLNSIIPAPWNTRGEITPKSVSELALSIGENGLINPITVWKCNTDKNHWMEWMCIAGNRRLAALKLLHGPNEHLINLTEGKDFIIFYGTEAEAKLITVTENLQREDVGPIEEAALVAECLDAGMTAEEIAAKTGRSASWVNRRRKLITLDEAWRKCTALPVDALEKIAAYPADVQNKVAKVRPNPQSWAEVKWHFESESKDLDCANFDTDDCCACGERTGCMADLFGDVEDGKLGKCLNAKCFSKRQKAHVDELIEAATKGAGEVVRVKYAWQLPSGDSASERKSKKHPCAYVAEDYGGEVKVVWGESQKAKKEREAAEQARRNEQNAEDDAKRKRADEITGKLDAWKDGGENDDGEYPNGLSGLIGKCLSTEGATLDFCVDAIADKITGWHDNGEWAEILRAFPAVAQLAGVSDEDAAYLVDEYGDDDNDEDNE